MPSSSSYWFPSFFRQGHSFGSRESNGSKNRRVGRNSSVCYRNFYPPFRFFSGSFPISFRSALLILPAGQPATPYRKAGEELQKKFPEKYGTKFKHYIKTGKERIYWHIVNVLFRHPEYIPNVTAPYLLRTYSMQKYLYTEIVRSKHAPDPLETGRECPKR